MADISNITVNEVNYDLKDTSARNSISTLEDNLSKKVDAVEGSSLITAEKLAQIGTNADKISSLVGEGSGSIEDMINSKINEWAAQLTDDGIVNTYAEALQWISSHGSEYTTLVGDVAKKVDAVSGKGLSTNDFTTVLKDKLDGIAEGATAVSESTVSDWGFSKTTGTYSKPDSGIPASDLAEGVIPTTLPASDTTDVYSATGTAPVSGKAVASAISGKLDSDKLVSLTKAQYDALGDKVLTDGVYYFITDAR